MSRAEPGAAKRPPAKRPPAPSRRRPPSPPSVIAWRLARHHLLERESVDPVEVVRDLGGAHAQIASAAELALAVRVDDLKPGQIGELLQKRKLVKTWAMRGALHYIAAKDLALWVAALSTRTPYHQPVWQRGFGVTLAQMEALMAAIGEALDGKALTREELDDEVVRRTDGSLAGRLRSGWGELLKPAAYQGLLCFGPAKGRNTTFVRPDQWVRGWKPSKLTREEALVEVARRYLHTYGPASHEHFGAWWGVAPARGRKVFRELGDELVEVDLAGEPASVLATDLPGIESARMPAGHLRLLPHFDPYKIGVRPRDMFVERRHYDRVFLKAGWMSPVVLREGRAVGVWAASKGAARTTITVEPFGRFDRPTLRAIEREADRLGPFLGAGAVEVVVGPVPRQRGAAA